MTPRLFVRCLLTPVTAAAFAFAAFPGTATAQAEVGKFFDQRVEVNAAATPECTSGSFSGTETLTFTTSGHFVATDSGFHVEGTESLDVHTVFTNGFHILGTASSHFAFNTTATSGQSVFTVAGHEVHTIYNADGEVAARVMFHSVSHITYRDLNGNEQPDQGEITVNFDRSFFTCL
jgi:hypothetical protein